MHLPPSAKAALSVLIFCVGCGAATWCAAQSEIGGTVSGQIEGPGGRTMAGAQVRIENASTGENTGGDSDTQGNFQFADLPPGEYTLRVRVPGLSNWEADHVLVGLGTATRLHPVLAPLTVHQTILVDGQGPRDSASAVDDATASLASELPNTSQH
ncbi:MAG: carboxypeptidase-like regulatory domain-containing protein, partial [Acidobacteriaceae bacterium]